MAEVKVGDTVKFRTLTRYGYKTGKRKVICLYESGVGVNFEGYRPFFVRHNEIKEVCNG